MKNQYLIVVAGGTGTRMQSTVPKQFLLINNTPVIILSVLQFLNYNPAIQIVISVHADYKTHLQEIILQYFSKHIHQIKIVIGGDTRFQSVKNALNAIGTDDGVVGIHDAARPFVSTKTIATCFETAEKLSNAIPVITIAESLRYVGDSNNKAVNRTDYKIVQTPQCFKLELIKKAFEQDYTLAFTDDATVFESKGHTINLVEGNVENIKITTPNDLKIAEFFQMRATDLH